MTNLSMLERCEEAFYNYCVLSGDYGSEEEMLSSCPSPPSKTALRGAIRAVLQTIRELDEGMISCGVENSSCDCDGVDGSLYEFSMKETWQAVIDHILSQQPTTD